MGRHDEGSGDVRCEAAEREPKTWVPAQTRFTELAEALKALLKAKREDPFAFVMVEPAAEGKAQEWADEYIQVCTDAGFGNVPTVAEFPVPEGWSADAGVADERRVTEDEEGYVETVADLICEATGLSSDAGWEVNDVGHDALEERSLRVRLLFDKDVWGARKKALEAFRRKWEGYGLGGHLNFDEATGIIEGEFKLHPKGGFFLKQRKLQKENEVRLAELKEFLLGLA